VQNCNRISGSRSASVRKLEIKNFGRQTIDFGRSCSKGFAVS
jgi:hypothetical protein